MRAFSFLVVLAASFALLWAGCDDSSKGVAEVPLPVEPPALSPAPLDELPVVDVYLDATLSMQGFVRPNRSRYDRLLSRLRNLAGSMGLDARRTTLYKFGSRVIPLAGEAGGRSALDPSFYEDQRISSTTRLDSVVERVKAGHLSVVVTDLFQDESNIDLLSRKLVSKVQQHGFALGIAGIRSAFDGMIYDVGRRNASFPHEGKRPFYMLVLGRHAAVASLFDEIRQDETIRAKEGDLQFLLLSPNMAMPVASFSGGATLESRTGIAEGSGGTGNSQVKHFRVDRANPQLKVRVRPSLLQHGPGLDLSRLNTDVSAWQQRRQRRSAQEGDTLQDSKSSFDASSEAAEAVKSQFVEVSDTAFTLRTSWKSDMLPDAGTYFYSLVLRPRSESVSPPAWVADWTLSADSLAYWEDHKQDFPGHQTLYLQRFLSDLTTATTKAYHPRLAQLYAFVEYEG